MDGRLNTFKPVLTPTYTEHKLEPLKHYQEEILMHQSSSYTTWTILKLAVR